MFTNEFEVKCGGAKQTNTDRMNELGRAVRSGNVDCMDELFELASSYALRVAKRMVANQEDAEDIAQEALLQLFEDINTVYTVSAWLRKVVSNKVSDAKKEKFKASKVFAFDTPMDDSMGDIHHMMASEVVADFRISVNPEAVFTRAIAIEAVPQILALLPDKQREVLYLYHFEDYPQDKVAAELGISRSTVAAHVRKGHANFQRGFATRYDVSLLSYMSAYELGAA